MHWHVLVLLLQVNALALLPGLVPLHEHAPELPNCVHGLPPAAPPVPLWCLYCHKCMRWPTKPANVLSGVLEVTSNQNAAVQLGTVVSGAPREYSF